VSASGWLVCDGTAISRTTYSLLFAVVGTSYGAGDGSTTFNLPDLRGRTPVGYAAGGHADVATLGLNDGTALANRRPKHRHTPHSHTYNTYAFDANAGSGSSSYSQHSGSGATSSVDGGSGNANDPLDAAAYLVINHIIKT